MKRTRKYLAASQAVKQLGDGGKALVRSGDQEELYRGLEAAGYWWNHKSGAWEKAQAGQGKGGRFTLQPGVYRIRITCHRDDAEALARIVAGQHQVVDISFFMPNVRDGTPEIGRIYITCKR